MKKLILSLFAAGFAASSFAQAPCCKSGFAGNKQGNLLIYGMASYSSLSGNETEKFGTFNSQTTNIPRVNKWTLSPGIGFNVTNNLTVGAELNWRNSNIVYDRLDTSVIKSFPAVDQKKTFDYALGVFVRHTMRLSDVFFCYGQASAHFLYGRESYRTVTALVGGNSWLRDNNYRGWDLGFMPAIGANLTKTLGMTFAFGGVSFSHKEFDLRYDRQYWPAGSNKERTENQFDFSFAKRFELGIQKYIVMNKRHHKMAEPMDETRQMDTNDDK